MRRLLAVSMAAILIALSASAAQADCFENCMRYMGCGFGEGYHARAHYYYRSAPMYESSQKVPSVGKVQSVKSVRRTESLPPKIVLPRIPR